MTSSKVVRVQTWLVLAYSSAFGLAATAAAGSALRLMESPQALVVAAASGSLAIFAAVADKASSTWSRRQQLVGLAVFCLTAISSFTVVALKHVGAVERSDRIVFQPTNNTADETRTDSANCEQQSINSARIDSFRCFASTGIFDPCFATTGLGKSRILCPGLSGTIEFTDFVLGERRPFPDEPGLSVNFDRPYAFELEDGRRCQVRVGGTASGFVAGSVYWWFCSEGDSVSAASIGLVDSESPVVYAWVSEYDWNGDDSVEGAFGALQQLALKSIEY